VDGQDEAALGEIAELLHRKKRLREEPTPEEASELTASMSPAKKAKDEKESTADPMEIV
jgi:hypothetical protein